MHLGATKGLGEEKREKEKVPPKKTEKKGYPRPQSLWKEGKKDQVAAYGVGVEEVKTVSHTRVRGKGIHILSTLGSFVEEGGIRESPIVLRGKEWGRKNPTCKGSRNPRSLNRP